MLAAAGFTLAAERNRRDFVLNLGREMRARAAEHGAPPLGPHIIMGPAAPERLRNVMGALEQGVIAPVELIARTL